MKRQYLVALALIVSAFAGSANAQWQVEYIIDNTQATTALGPNRVPKMYEAVARVKTKLEQLLANNTGYVVSNSSAVDNG